MLLPQTEIGDDPAVLADFVDAVDEAGFTHLALYDHVLGVDAAAHPGWAGPYGIEDQFHEVLVLLGWLAGRSRLELVTEVLVLPQRPAALVAKQAAEVDVLSGGRLRLGVGIGWNAVEMDGLGQAFADRAQRFEEQVEVLRRLWCDDVVTFTGRFHRLEAVGLRPRPVQRPIPLWMGGGGIPASQRRIGRLADGWMAMLAPGHGLEPAWQAIRQAAAAAGRDPDRLGLEGTVRPGRDLARLERQVGRWAAAGATHVAVSGLGAGLRPAEHVAFVGTVARVLFG